MRYLYIFLLGSLAACNAADQKAKVAGSETTGTVNRDSVNGVLLRDTANYTQIQWIDSTHQELGNINEGQVLDVSWKLKNAGSKPLVITNVTAGCGCTVAEKPEEPIAPGADGIIKAKFNSKGQAAGPHTKSVTVQANTNDQVYYLNFTVNVATKS